MRRLDEFFQDRGVAVDEALVVDALESLLGDRLTTTGGVPLPEGDQHVLERHAGLRPAPDDERRAVASTAAEAADLAARSLTVDQVAARAGVSPSRVRHWIGDGAVHAVRVGSRNLLPAWQFGADGRPLPHLGRVLAALPDDLHPLSVVGFFTTPEPELDVDGRPLDPASWLAGGGDPEPVVELAGGLGHLV